MSSLKISITFLILFFIGVAFYMSTYIVYEGQAALLLRLGEIKIDPATNKPDVELPGLHFKLPVINDAEIFDTRLQTLSVESSRILTAEQKYVLVDYYAKWRINDLALYYTRTGGDSNVARDLLTQKINDALRAEFGKRKLDEVISDARDNIMHALQTQASESANNLGISVIDVRIKKIDLPSDISGFVFNNMSSKRAAVAAQYRADGLALAAAIRANADFTAAVTVAKANAQALQIRGEGDALAAKTYADAYNKDPAFYAYYRSLHIYQESFSDKNDILVLKPNNQFFNYFNNTSSDNSRKNPNG